MRLTHRQFDFFYNKDGDPIFKGIYSFDDVLALVRSCTWDKLPFVGLNARVKREVNKFLEDVKKGEEHEKMESDGGYRNRDRVV